MSFGLLCQNPESSVGHDGVGYVFSLRPIENVDFVVKNRRVDVSVHGFEVS